MLPPPFQELSHSDKYNKLPEASCVPWSERDVLNVLCEGRAKEIAANLPIDVVHRLSYLLQVGLQSIGVWRGVSKEVGDGRRPPVLQAGHP
jgi:hypothetical protein